MKPNIAIIGAGITGTTLAYHLANAGYEVDVFERGKDNPYPHLKQFEAQIVGGADENEFEERFAVPRDVRTVTQEGDYPSSLIDEQITIVGGKAAYWGAMTPRMSPKDFKTQSLFHYGRDWPISYDDLEPYYCKAESHLQISGTDADNPFAPHRSKPYPLPAFDLSYSAKIFADRLKQKGIAFGRHPQARTREAADGRPACVNFGTCLFCPIGARYSPVLHLDRAVATKRVRVHTRSSVRRILVDASGRARGLLYQKEDAKQPVEHPASVVILTGGPIESSRLLLLSTDERHRDGVGNQSGLVGKGFFMHHCESFHAEYKEAMWPNRTHTGFGTSFQFIDSPKRGKHGGFKVNAWDTNGGPHPKEDAFFARFGADKELLTGRDAVAAFSAVPRCESIGYDGEVVPGDSKYVQLGTKKDRFGDRVAHVHYKLDDFDRETMREGEALIDRFFVATGGNRIDRSPQQISSGHHHMGGLRMGDDEHTSVVDKHGRVHGTPNLFVVGGATFPGFSAVNPTLTMVALAIRASEMIEDQYK